MLVSGSVLSLDNGPCGSAWLQFLWSGWTSEVGHPLGVWQILLDGHGDLVSRLIIGIIGVIIWLIGLINLLTKSP